MLSLVTIDKADKELAKTGGAYATLIKTKTKTKTDSATTTVTATNSATVTKSRHARCKVLMSWVVDESDLGVQLRRTMPTPR